MKGRLFLYDLRYGMLKQVGIYLLVVIMTLWGIMELNTYEGTFNMADCAGFIFQGISFYKAGEDFNFLIPFLWLTFLITPSFMIGYYARSEFTGFGTLMMVKTGSRKLWWFSKVVWNLLSVSGYYLTIYLTIYIYGKIKGLPATCSFSFLEHLMVPEYISMEGRSGIMFFLMLVMLPYMVTVTLCLGQMVLSFFINPLYSYMVVIIYLIMSVYLPWHGMLGSYAMIMRNETYCKNGMHTIAGIIMMIVLQIIIVAIGYNRVRRMDVLD